MYILFCKYHQIGQLSNYDTQNWQHSYTGIELVTLDSKKVCIYH